MTTINDELRLREGDTNQTYGKLHVDSEKDLHFVDSDGNDTNLTEDGYLKSVYVLDASVSKTSSDTFVEFTIPANTVQVGTVITVMAVGKVTSYSSGTARISIRINGNLVADSETGTPANGWGFFGNGMCTFQAVGSSGSVQRGGMGVLGPQESRNQTANIPVLINNVDSIDTTQDIGVCVNCEIVGGSLTWCCFNQHQDFS